ncbi:cupin domain-containing protein [Amycolatopsis acidicola]|uniref:Cupin domain-containing protein n=1 Tax=Amycolatopsis acidicola TaxID=2596893 RepID=A0A5N0VGK3_9PSEU|nr:cupin domain-containing protein [Amycolatopsis acidicola]KAA9165479.1 cupin domain-containing protein [Amycolatopsis acidicola]
MTVASLADAPRFENFGFVFRPLAVPSRGSTELAVWTLEMPPGATGERHTVSCEEVFVLQAGEVRFEVGDTVPDVAVGDAVIVPPGGSLRLSNPGSSLARLVVCTSKGILGTIKGKTIVPPWAQ